MAKSKKPTSEKHPRLVKRGDVVRVKDYSGALMEEVVRGVDLILHLANGADVVVGVDSPITYIIDPDPEEEVGKEVAELNT